MKYLIIDTEKMKLYPYDNLDELVNKLRTETEVVSTVEEPLKNIIFNTQLFDTPEKLVKLKDTIENFFCDNPTKDYKKLNVRNKNQYFCLYAALWSRTDVLENTKISNFIRQMVSWFPQWTSDEKDLKAIKLLMEALYDEQKNWKLNDEPQKVTEWYKFIDQGCMSETKVKHFNRLALDIYTSINQLVKNL